MRRRAGVGGQEMVRCMRVRKVQPFSLKLDLGHFAEGPNLIFTERAEEGGSTTTVAATAAATRTARPRRKRSKKKVGVRAPPRLTGAGINTNLYIL